MTTRKVVTHKMNVGELMSESCGLTQVALTMFAAGLACIYVVWDCDRQRQMFRNSHGKCRIWGKVPSKVSQTTCVKILAEGYICE